VSFNLLPTIRLLVSYVTAGTGHRRAAEAIAQEFAGRHPGAGVRCLDVLTYAPEPFHACYAWAYLFLVRHAPWVWRCSYALLDWAPVYRLVQPLRRAWNLAVTRRFVALLRQRPPDLIVATHFLPADVCSAGRRSGWLRAPLVVVVTDLYPHWFWTAGAADAFVVATERSRRALERRGIPRERIHVLGIPIGPGFGRPADRRALAARFRLRPERHTVLVTSGGTTVGHFEQAVRALAALETELPGRLQLLVVCGEDADAKARLEAFAQRCPMPVRVFGFVGFMADLMAASDLVVAKAGGLTVSEALACGLPLVLYHVIPGQERQNAQHVAEHGAGVIALNAGEVAAAVRRCLTEPARLRAMAEAAVTIGRPDAAAAIVTRVLEPLLSSTVHRPQSTAGPDRGPSAVD
jgi:processive 1,2-diacylglycerol beta-glucosyltransferase